MASNFKLTFSTKATDVTPVYKYKSQDTGLTVIIADVEGPIVSAYICLATEAHDDDGLPHTLEHLIFLGSEKYPFKGILDLLANRCLASGTNAWTDVDHTAYTLHTAGSSGLLTMLPIYMDHILFPQLTDHGYTTEVHHISPEGRDAGVVYCEMQGRENSAESRCYNKLLNIIYEGSGYSSETGGKLYNLRNSTNNKKVRDYHHSFYRPENIYLVICGKLNHEDVFNVLKPIEDTIISKGKKSEFNKPWQSPVPPLERSKVEKVPYPTDCEDSGMVMLGWRGPHLLTPEGLFEFTALSILLRYFTETPIAPLQEALTEVEQPYAGDVVNNLVENSPSMLVITLENVPVDKLDAATDLALSIIHKVCHGEMRLDLDRIVRLLRLQRRETLSHTESNPHEHIAFMCIADMLHSQEAGQMELRLNKQNILIKLEEKSLDWWKNVCDKYLGQHHAVVIGIPSTKLMEDMIQEEEERIKSQVEELGKNGLEKKGTILMEAMEYNEREVPSEVLESVGGAAHCEDIPHLEVLTWDTRPPSHIPPPPFPLSQMPFYTLLHHIQTHFVYMKLLIDSDELSCEERMWLPLLTAVLTECPIKRNDVLLPHTVLLSEIEDLTNNFSLGLGIRNELRFSPGIFGQSVTFDVQCEPQKYESVVNLMWEVMNCSEINKERLLVVAQRMIQEVTTIRREGDRLVKDILRDINYKKESNVHLASVLRQQKFLKSIVKKLETEGETTNVLNEVDEVRKKIFATKNIWLQIAANFKNNDLTADPWKKFINGETNITAIGRVTRTSEVLRGGEERWGRGSVVGVGGLESSFLLQYSPGPDSYSHPQYPALMVALQYFSQLEGPLWKSVRGAGLAYGCNLIPMVLEGAICMNLYKTTNPIAAYQQTLKVIKTFLTSGEWDESLFISARSSLVFEILQKIKTASFVIKEALCTFCYGLDENFVKELAQSVCQVSENDAREAAKQWLPHLMDPSKNILSVVCNPSKVHHISTELKQMGHNITPYNTLEESHLNNN